MKEFDDRFSRFLTAVNGLNNATNELNEFLRKTPLLLVQANDEGDVVRLEDIHSIRSIDDAVVISAQNTYLGELGGPTLNDEYDFAVHNGDVEWEDFYVTDAP